MLNTIVYIQQGGMIYIFFKLEQKSIHTCLTLQQYTVGWNDFHPKVVQCTGCMQPIMKIGCNALCLSLTVCVCNRICMCMSGTKTDINSSVASASSVTASTFYLENEFFSKTILNCLSGTQTGLINEKNAKKSRRDTASFNENIDVIPHCSNILYSVYCSTCTQSRIKPIPDCI